jgi:hypothetical protein
MKTYFKSSIKPPVFAALIAAAGLFCLPIAGCDTVTRGFNHQAGDNSRQTETEGIVQINLASYSGTTAAHSPSVYGPLRTVLPTGLTYTVTFTADGKDAVPLTVDDTTAVVTLAPGLWQAEAEAMSGDNVVARGSGEVRVISGRTALLDIALAPMADSGSGTFSYTITNLAPADYTKAEMKITYLKDNTDKAILDFKRADPPPTTATNTGYAAGHYLLTLTLEKKTAVMVFSRAVKTEIIHIYEGATTAFTLDANTADTLRFAYLPKPALFFDHGTRVTDADTDWEAVNTYHVASGQKVVLAPVIANAPEGAVYEWSIDNGPVAGTGEYLRGSFTAASSQVTVKMKVDAVTHASASTLVKAVPSAAARAKTAGSKADAAVCIEFSPAPGQFVGKGSAYSNPTITGLSSKTEAQVAAIFQNYMDGTAVFNNAEVDGKVFSLGGWGGYYTMYFDHSVQNGTGADIEIAGNSHVAGMNEPGVVWVSQDVNGDGKPNEIWYRIKGPGTERPRYAITYFKPTSKAAAFWIDSDARNNGFLYFSNGNDGFPYHITGTTGTYVTFAGVLTGGGSGYVDAGAGQFDIANAVDEAGQPAALTYIDFVKVQTAINEDAGGMGEYSTEAGIPRDLH